MSKRSTKDLIKRLDKDSLKIIVGVSLMLILTFLASWYLQKGQVMWDIKDFDTEQDMMDWILENQEAYQYDIVFINNGYAVEYKKRKVIDLD